MNNLSENIKLYFRKRKRRLSISGVRVDADWAGILYLVIVCSVVGAVYAGFLYKGILSGSAFEVEEAAPLPDNELKKQEIAETVEFLRGN